MTAATDLLVLDFISVPMTLSAGVLSMLSVSGPVETILVRNVVVTSDFPFEIVTGSPRALAIVNSVIDAPFANLMDVGKTSRLIVDNSVIVINTL